ncbi:MAG: SulP family inorganic anion transporter [Acidimicrobiales bacterium]
MTAPAQAEPTAPKRRSFPLFQGLLPLDRTRIPVEVVAGITLAALAIPEVMGYTTIAGMPVITGLYTILLPVLAFAVFGSSRHLVVGADSATAAVMAAGLVGLAATGSDQYVALAGLLALMAAALLLLARLIGLGFLADFLSRTVLIGFLTGVGIQVACGQIGGMLGIPSGSGVTIASHTFDNTVGKLITTLENVDQISWTTVAVSAGVMATILGMKFITGKIPGALIAVIGAIFVSWKWDLVSHGVATLGVVPSGLPKIGLPDVSWSDVPALMGTAVSIFVLILAQSAATSRAYAAKYNDAFDENVDLIGLGVANIAAGLSGTFPVNGSPTKTQMVDGAGGRSQLSQLTTGVIVAIVLLFLTVPLQYMPKAVLSTVVFLIGVELVDLAGMRRILELRVDEFVVATLTALTVVFVGVEQGIVLAIVASLIDHLRRSYRPPTAVLEPTGDESPAGRDWHSVPAVPSTRTVPGLAIYRFSSSLYYANANHFAEEVLAFATDEAGGPLEWICIDAASIDDIDYTGGQTLIQLHGELAGHGVRLVFAEVQAPTRAELDRFGITELFGADAIYPTMLGALDAFRNRAPSTPTSDAPAATTPTDGGDSIG